jgi:K+-transporting ATPase ATPase C chain
MKESSMNTTLASHIRPAVVAMFLLTALTGVIYPLLVTLVAQAVFPWQANGSFVDADGARAAGAHDDETKAAGSVLIGQAFDGPRYFWSRISATSPAPYNAASSSGSNLGPRNPALIDAVKGRIAALRAADGADARPIPVDLVTSSASGLDPHISPAAALWQIPRVAAARGIDAAKLRTLVDRHTERRQLGILGEPRVNVLLLNLELDRASER